MESRNKIIFLALVGVLLLSSLVLSSQVVRAVDTVIGQEEMEQRAAELAPSGSEGDYDKDGWSDKMETKYGLCGGDAYDINRKPDMVCVANQITMEVMGLMWTRALAIFFILFALFWIGITLAFKDKIESGHAAIIAALFALAGMMGSIVNKAMFLWWDWLFQWGIGMIGIMIGLAILVIVFMWFAKHGTEIGVEWGGHLRKAGTGIREWREEKAAVKEEKATKKAEKATKLMAHDINNVLDLLGQDRNELLRLMRSGRSVKYMYPKIHGRMKLAMDKLKQSKDEVHQVVDALVKDETLNKVGTLGEVQGWLNRLYAGHFDQAIPVRGQRNYRLPVRYMAQEQEVDIARLRRYAADIQKIVSYSEKLEKEVDIVLGKAYETIGAADKKVFAGNYKEAVTEIDAAAAELKNVQKVTGEIGSYLQRLDALARGEMMIGLRVLRELNDYYPQRQQGGGRAPPVRP